MWRETSALMNDATFRDVVLANGWESIAADAAAPEVTSV
jgi:hypothetical protein